MGASPALALVALAACSRGGGAAKTVSALGPARTVAWAVGTPGSDFVLEISLGIADAAEMLGWRFTRVLNAQPTPDAHVNAIRQAVTARADVVVTVDWYQAVVDEVAAGQRQGAHFAIVNSLNNPEAMAPLNVPYVGQDPRDSGRLVGKRIGEALAKRGVSTGSVLVGNPFPGSLNVEERIAGLGEGLAGTPGLKLVSFPDGSAQDAATSVGLYKAKIGRLGDVVAYVAASGEMSAVPLFKALGELEPAGQKPLVGGWVSSLKVLNLVKSGQMAFALDENLYLQGFMAVQLAWSMLERRMPAMTLDSGHNWVDSANVDAMIASYQRRKDAARAYGLA
ncbi:MAG: substrate-binding domain-containing protein [Pseudomonadota bacterium]